MKAVAAALLLVCALAHAQDTGDDPVLSIVTQARSRGCTSNAGSTAPLRWSKPLARIASRMHDGEAALDAASRENYRATRIFHATVSGARTSADAAHAFAQHYCKEIVDPRVKDFAVHRQGANWDFVLAAPLELPQLADRAAVADRVLSLVNDARSRARRCGSESFGAAPPLRANPRLAQAAQAHAQDMAAHEYLDHVSRDGSTFGQRVTRAGYRWHDVGENIAAGQHTPQEVVDAWVASPGHCANLMNPVFVEMGVAFAVNMKSDAAVYWAQEFGRRQ